MRKCWNKEEIEYLVNNYENTYNTELSKVLNRTVIAIALKASELKLTKSESLKKEWVSKRNKTIGRDLTEEKLIQIALLYKTRGEFQEKDPSAYTTARIKFDLDKICKHMVVGNYSKPQLLLNEIVKILFNTTTKYNCRTIIKPYELDVYIDEFKLAFEYNGSHWHGIKNNDEIKKSRCIENGITLITIIENSRDYINDIKSQLVLNLPLLNNITGLNITKEDILNISDSLLIDNIKSSILNEDDIKRIVSKYTNHHKFVISEPKLYSFLLRNKLLVEYLSELNKDRTIWNDDLINIEISKYTYLDDFIKNSLGCYLHLRRNNLEYKFSNLIKKNIRWNFNLIEDLILNENLNTTYKLKKYYPSAFAWIKKNKLIIECREVMKQLIIN